VEESNDHSYWRDLRSSTARSGSACHCVIAT